ncbi:Alanine-anticapsin ligase BacD [Variovorax sp. PBL-H6]|uniref:ATP-grasp domain-containing protein n=1 Tax=Variovorax sp. PBL-H6 TaxID=434009 RepID=UPI001317A86A|nr:ATP-grasp domain-containing protein [Variovorax sp. PBL-H6]VTU34510.1 Alanine-anticapsin ligase BacD [Variovorax sp. PBL-H6]
MSNKKKLLIVEVLSRGPALHYRYDVFKSKGYELFYLTTSPGVRYAFEGLKVVPSRQINDFIVIATAWHKAERFDAIITTDEASVIATAVLAERLKLPGPSIQAARCSRNKLLMREAHRRHNAPHPEFARCDEVEDATRFAERVGYPVVIKPTLGADSEHVYRADNAQQLAQRFAQAMAGNNNHSHRFAEAECDEMGPHTLLAEAFLQGPEHCVEAIVEGDQIYIGSIADRLSMEMDVFDNDLYSTPTALSAEQIAAVSKAVLLGAKAQGIERGVLHAELRFHDGKPHIVEIAARPGGGSLQYMAKISYGYCSISAALRVAEDKPPSPVPMLRPTGRVAVGLTMLCDEGCLQSVEIPQGLLPHPDIFNFTVLPKAGSVIKRPPHGNDIFAYIGATGDTLDAALRNAATIAARVRVRFETDETAP